MLDVLLLSNNSLLRSELDSSESNSEEISEFSSEEFSSESSSEVSSEESLEESSEVVYTSETIDYSESLYVMNQNIVTLTDRFTHLSIVVYFAVGLSVICLIYRIFAWFWKDL